MSTAPIRSQRLKLRTHVADAETIVSCSGRLTSADSDWFKTEVRALVAGAKVLVLDFTQLEYLDSSGIGAVVSLYVTSKSAGCELRLVNFSKRVRELLGLTGLLKIFGDCGTYMIKMP